MSGESVEREAHGQGEQHGWRYGLRLYKIGHHETVGCEEVKLVSC